MDNICQRRGVAVPVFRLLDTFGMLTVHVSYTVRFIFLVNGVSRCWHFWSRITKEVVGVVDPKSNVSSVFFLSHTQIKQSGS